MASMPAGILILVCWVSLGVYWNISARSIKSAAGQQNLAARLARMPVWVGFVLFVAAWVHPFGPVAIRRTVLSDSVGVSICAGTLGGHLVAQGAGRRVEPGRR